MKTCEDLLTLAIAVQTFELLETPIQLFMSKDMFGTICAMDSDVKHHSQYRRSHIINSQESLSIKKRESLRKSFVGVKVKQFLPNIYNYEPSIHGTVNFLLFA